MNRITKLIITGLCMVCMQVAYAQNSGSSSCAPQGDCKPRALAPSAPKPCPPKPCKPCPPVCFERGYPDTKCCIPSAYNEPANFELSPCPWNFWLDASFTYWTAYEEGLDLAHTTATYASSATTQVVDFLFQHTKWEPGFKVGLGVDFGHDHWSGFAEYTWFRSRTSTSVGLPTAPTGATVPLWVVENWALDSGGTNVSAIASTWRLRMDLLDVGLTRPYYQGTHLIVAPFAGVRGTWIRQNLKIHPTPFSSDSVLNANAFLHNKSSAWAVGPRGGLQGKWHLGWGFRIEGDMAGSIAFTRYTKVAARADIMNYSTPQHPTTTKYTDYNTIRFNNDMSVGLGWGDYFDCRNYHFDLLATYDFQIFWNQNMMRPLVDNQADDVSFSAHNLYLQGLTVRAEFDF